MAPSEQVQSSLPPSLPAKESKTIVLGMRGRRWFGRRGRAQSEFCHPQQHQFLTAHQKMHWRRCCHRHFASLLNLTLPMQEQSCITLEGKKIITPAHCITRDVQSQGTKVIPLPRTIVLFNKNHHTSFNIQSLLLKSIKPYGELSL